MNYNLKTSNGHSIVEIESASFLIDTGWPCSFSFDGAETIKINDIDFSLSFPNFERRPVEELVDCKVDGFIGMDVLSRLEKVEFNYIDGVFIAGDISGNHNAMNQWPISIDNLGGQKVISTKLNMEPGEAKVIIDTGAWIGYVTEALTNGCEKLGHIRDYNPAIGEIEGDTFSLKINSPSFINNQVGIMPKDFDSTLTMFGYSGILGLKTDGMIGLDFQKGIIVFNN